MQERRRGGRGKLKLMEGGAGMHTHPAAAAAAAAVVVGGGPPPPQE